MNTNPVVGSITSKGSAKTGNTCDNSAHTVALYLDTYGCPSCSLCGERHEITSDTNIMLFNTTYEWSYVAEVSIQGIFTPDSCKYFSETAQVPCGCTNIMVDNIVETTADTTTDIEGDKDSDLDVGDFIETGNSGNMIDGDIEPPLSNITAEACSANSAYSRLSDDCCPTTSGERLGCCSESIATASDTDTNTIAITGILTPTPTIPPSDASIAIKNKAPSVVPVVNKGAPSLTSVVVDTTAAPTVALVDNRDITTHLPNTPAPSAAPIIVDPVVPEVRTTKNPTNGPITKAPVTADTVCSICFFEDSDVPNPDGMISIPGSSGNGTSEISCEEAARLSSALGVGDELCVAIQREAAASCCGIVVEANTFENVPPNTFSPTSSPTITPTLAVTILPTVPEAVVVEKEEPT